MPTQVADAMSLEGWTRQPLGRGDEKTDDHGVEVTGERSATRAHLSSAVQIEADLERVAPRIPPIAPPFSAT